MRALLPVELAMLCVEVERCWAEIAALRADADDAARLAQQRAQGSDWTGGRS